MNTIYLCPRSLCKLQITKPLVRQHTAQREEKPKSRTFRISDSKFGFRKQSIVEAWIGRWTDEGDDAFTTTTTATTMVSTTGGSANITEDEAQLYDRQIRLWGLDAQKRLRASRVLVAGLRGLGCEVAKNLVLSGVKSLRVLDGGTLSEEDLESNFLCPVDKVGSAWTSR